LLLTVCLSAVADDSARTQELHETEFREKLQPFLAKYCLSCHNEKEKKANLDLTKFGTAESILTDRKKWQRAADYIASGEMPPEESPQPEIEVADSMATWIGTMLASQPCDPSDSGPGQVTLRRLNRVEYRNTVRDLVGVDYKPTDDFPSDDVGYGFDNIGDVLTLSTVLMEKYFSAAEQIAEEAILSDEARFGPASSIDLEKSKSSAAVHAAEEGRRYFISNGTVQFSVKAEKPGEYRLKVRGWGDQGGDQVARMKLIVEGLGEAVIDVPAVRETPGEYELKVKFDQPGERSVTIEFVNDAYLQKSETEKGYDRNLMVESAQWVGPAPASPPKPLEFQRKLFACHPAGDHTDDCVKKILSDLAERAFRRPPRSSETGRLFDLVQESRRSGESFESGIQLALKAILISPHFLFKMEADPNFESDAKVRNLNDYELATRLSYFLHSSMPDAELYKLARSGQLSKDDVLEKQVRRLLNDARVNQFVDNFGMQWLQLRNLQNIGFDTKRFPKFNGELRRAFYQETRQFLTHLIREDRSVLELIDADYTFVNDKLADHYGIDGVSGRQFRKITLKDSNRGGLITQASILSVTSNPTRTSPVKRGRWILEQLLGTPPPPPPPNVPELMADEAALSGTLRQQMEQHRKDPACATCHTKMDPLGFGLENFDAVGGWRSLEGKEPIDSTGELPSGEKFAGPGELKKILLGRKKEFVRNLAEKMMIYALGRGLDSQDQCAIEEIVKTVETDDYKFSRLVLEIVRSDPFRKRLTAKAKP
jgi:hypothetical protein